MCLCSKPVGTCHKDPLFHPRMIRPAGGGWTYLKQNLCSGGCRLGYQMETKRLSGIFEAREAALPEAGLPETKPVLRRLQIGVPDGNQET